MSSFNFPDPPAPAPQRRPSSSVGWLLGAIAFLLLVIAGGGAYFVWEHRKDRAAQAERKSLTPSQMARVERMILANNRAYAANEQQRFWMDKDAFVAVDLLTDLKNDCDRNREAFEREEWELMKEKGREYPSLGDADEPRSHQFNAVVEKTRVLVKQKLDANYLAYLKDRTAEPADAAKSRLMKVWIDKTAQEVRSEMRRLEASVAATGP